MQRRLFLFVLLSALFFQNAKAQNSIREITSFQQVNPVLRQEAVVVLDLDNTTMEPVQTLGSDQAFSYWVQKLKSHGLSDEQAVAESLKAMTPIQPYSEVKAVEGFVPQWIQNLQQRRVVVFALTARPSAWAAGTLGQLKSLNVDFSRTAPFPQSTNQGVSFKYGTYQRGIIFLNPGAPKGEALLEFLNSARLSQRPIIFVDDKIRNVQSVAQSLDQAGLRHIEFRYGAADPRVRAFNPQVLEVQFKYFRQRHIFLSDLEALRIIYPVSQR